MATPSALLRGAASAAQKTRDFNDSLAAYQWDNSPKTYADYLAYDGYLESQSQGVADPGTLLAYQKKRDSARSGYISNEIQRQSIDVIEGNTSNVDKYDRMLNLYYQAADAGQNDLAQGLRLQLDNLSVTIQNEVKSAISANKEASAEITKNIDNQVKDAVDQINENAKYALDQYQKLGPDEFQKATGSDIFSMLANMVNSQDPNNPGLVQIYSQASQVTPDPSKIREYQTKFNGLANGESTGIKLPGVGELTYKDITDQVQAQSTGQTLFDTVDTAQGTQFVKNKTTGYEWGRDANGNYQLMPILNANQNFTSAVPGKKGKNQQYSDVLANNGFDVISQGDNLVVRNNGEFDSAGVPRGQRVQLYVDASGNLQAINGNKAFNLGFDQTGKFTGLNEQAPNPINLLPSGNQRFSRFNNPYFAGQDLTNLPAGAIGVVDTTSPIARTMEAGPLARPQPVLQSNALYHQAPSGTPQPAALTGTVQSAVSPLGLPANTQLTIAQPQPLPKITVAKVQPLPNLNVTQAKPQPTLSVSTPQPVPRIVF